MTGIPVVDFHAHAFPDSRAAGVLANMARKSSIPHYSDGTVAGLKTSMAVAGVDLALVSRITEKPGGVASVNRWLKSIEGGCLRVAGTLHPEDPHALAEVKKLADEGFRGVKLHPDYQGFRVEERRLYPLYEELQKRGFFVLFHAGLDRGLPGVPPAARPKGLRRVITDFPGLKVVAAHLGGEEIYHETEEHLLGCEIYLDTSFILRKIDPGTLKRIILGHTPSRIIWGSDSPWTDQGADIAFIRSLPYLTPEEKDAILGGNALKLLGHL